MGEMADMALIAVLETESLRDDYVCGHMSDEDAFDHDFLDPLGVEAEGMQTAWDRQPVGTKEELDRDVRELGFLIDLLRG